MAKVKVTETTWTVWYQETKQTNVELEDGRKLEVRQMEDDNGVETYYRLLGEGDWISSTHYNHQFEDKELEKIVNTIAYNSFQDVFTTEGEVVDLDELDSEEEWM